MRGFVSVILVLFVVFLSVWTHYTVFDDGGLRGTMWKGQRGDANVTIEFSRLGYIVGTPVITYSTEAGNNTSRDSFTYTMEAQTLSFANGERLIIDSKSNEKLILSGGPWNLDKTVFERKK